MGVFIRSTGAISPQETFGSVGFLEDIKVYNADRLACIHPDYRAYIPPATARRMGKIIKMGFAAASACLEEGNEKNPDAIIIGTGMGCVEDTERFLLAMIENNEKFLTPTSFIQSTHNTVGGQIALFLECNNYNFTYVHRGFSFESALLDAMLLFQEGETCSVLLGGVDEFTENHFNIYQKLGHWKGICNNLQLLNSQTPGMLPGEGAAFFLLKNKKEEGCYAEIKDLKTVYRPVLDLKSAIEAFFVKNKLDASSIDLVVLGLNGHVEEDAIYYSLQAALLPSVPAAAFKHLCGDYPTASSFGLWFSAQILKNQHIPDTCMVSGNINKRINTLLFINHFREDYFSLTLLTTC